MRGSASRWILVAVLMVAAILGVSSNAYAQAGTAALAGTVKDAQGAVVPGATVSATNPATGATRTGVSSERKASSISSVSLPGPIRSRLN